MNLGIDPEGLFAIYADWIAFLREKRVSFEKQLAKVQGKDSSAQTSTSKLQEQETEAAPLPVSLSPPTLPNKDKKTNPQTSSPIFAGASSLKATQTLPNSRIDPTLDEKLEEIPNWLWQTERVQDERLHLDQDQLDPHEASSSRIEHEEELDDWM